MNATIKLLYMEMLLLEPNWYDKFKNTVAPALKANWETQSHCHAAANIMYLQHKYCQYDCPTNCVGAFTSKEYKEIDEHFYSRLKGISW